MESKGSIFSYRYGMILAGIDYSMTSPAICVWKNNANSAFRFEDCSFYYLNSGKHPTPPNVHGDTFPEYTSEIQRFMGIANWAKDVLESSNVDRVLLEGYSMGSRGRVFAIAENTAILKYQVCRLGIPLDTIPPTTMKKLSSGKGNSDKDQMYDAFRKQTNVDLLSIMTPRKKKSTSPVSDVVDSFFLCKCLAEGYASVVK